MKSAGILFIVAMIIFTSSPICASEVSVTIQEWTVPTENSFPHDPAEGPDGSLWYTGIMSNTLGRLDPKTGNIKEYRLPVQDSGPHGLAFDRNGNIWFTANYKGYIGKLDTVTGKVTEYPMPDNSASDPHSLVIDSKGIIWFTVQRGNFVGRLDPATGHMRLKSSPTPNSLPYGIALDSRQVPFFCEFGTNKIGSINPETMAITEHKLPEGSRPRRIVVDRNDIIYFTEYARGVLGRLDPVSGKVREWRSPGGPKSKPYGITAANNGMIWYSESGVTPNTVVRFDPRIESFSTWAIPSGGGVVRNMVTARDGNLYLACSGKNKVAVARITTNRP